MSRYDYIIAKELIDDQHVSLNALIMALMYRMDGGAGYRLLRDHFPSCTQEFWDRHYGVNGYLRGESTRADNDYRERDTEEIALSLGRKKAKH